MLDAVEKKVQDPSFDREADLLPLLNEGIKLAARNHLADLQAESEIVTDPETNVLPMPKDYHHSLFHAFNVTRNVPCRVCYQLNTLHRMHTNDFVLSGSVENVAVEGKRFHYRRVPENPETIRVQYYGLPPIYEDDEDQVPHFIDGDLHRQILVNYVLWRVYQDLEDGVEGHRVNTQFYEGEFGKGLLILDSRYPKPSKSRLYYPRIVRTF